MKRSAVELEEAVGTWVNRGARHGGRAGDGRSVARDNGRSVGGRRGVPSPVAAYPALSSQQGGANPTWDAPGRDQSGRARSCETTHNRGIEVIVEGVAVGTAIHAADLTLPHT